MAQTSGLNRRDAFGGFALALTAFAGVRPAFAAQSQAFAPLGWTPRALTSAQARALDALAEAIMPATDTPGAREAGVPAFVDRAVAGWSLPAQAALIRAGLDRVDADARTAHGAAFAALAAGQQSALLTRYDAELAKQPAGSPHFFGVLKELVTIGFFTSEPGATRALRYDPVPGAYRGCVPLKEIGRGWAT